jgi:hypothetical protein
MNIFIILKGSLSKLKRFSYTELSFAPDYDEFMIPLLRRMINLEKLQLHVSLLRKNSTFIDGHQLHDQFLVYMTRLNQFTFNIITAVANYDCPIELQSQTDIESSFIGRSYGQVTSSISFNSDFGTPECLIYSLSYDLEYFHGLDNSFKNAVFHKVRQLMMADGISLEQNLFERISQGFPALEYLYLCNREKMAHRYESSTFITFPNLVFLDMPHANIDYVSFFLLKRNTHLPRLITLYVDMDDLSLITKTFTKDAMNFNFDTIQYLKQNEYSHEYDNWQQYFPRLKQQFR